MPGLIGRRPRLAVLGAFAMVASVLAVGASPASATPGTVDGAAAYSACVGPATADAGFTDVAAGSTHDAAINCIAYYGITRGTSATTFSPNRTIPRWQLAVMLQRAAGPAGATLGAAADQGFTDISDLSAPFQTAINQMAALGVMAGTTATTFDPNGVVSRAVIVEALAGFLTSARVGPGGKALTRNLDRSLTLRQSTAANAAVIPIDESFRDIGAVTYSAYQSILALAEMGVVSGRGDGTFGPAASVTRGQAASFITRALDHTNARPAGLTVQASKSAVISADELSLSVSVRGNDFSPSESVPVDVFSHLTENAAMAFKPDGTCQTAGSTPVAVAGTGTVACVVEVDDHVTEPNGNVMVDVDTPAKPTTYWVWTGAVGDSLDWDEANLSMDNSTVSDAASVSVTVSTAPASAKVTTSVSSDATGGNTVRYGDTVTVTIQLMDSAGKPIGVSGQSYQWWATGEHSPGTTRRPIPGTAPSTVTTDADGRASFSLTQADPDTDSDVDGPGEDEDANDMTTWTYHIARVGTAVALSDTAFGDDDDGIFAIGTGGAQGQGTLIFDDAPPAATKLSVELSRSWSLKPASGATARVGVTGKVTDQYGAPMRGKNIFFDLDGNNVFGCQTWVTSTNTCTTVGTGDQAVADHDDTDLTNDVIDGATRRRTRSNGTNTISAVYRSTAPVTNVFAAYQVATDFDNDGMLEMADDEIATAGFYWTDNPTGLDPNTGIASPVGYGPWRRVDLANKTLIHGNSAQSTYAEVAAGDVRSYTYKEGDLFIWYANAASNPANGAHQSNAHDTGTTGIVHDVNVRWLDVAEFERRTKAYMATKTGSFAPPLEVAPFSVDFRVRQYNAKGQSIFEIRAWGGDTAFLQDPPSN